MADLTEHRRTETSAVDDKSVELSAPSANNMDGSDMREGRHPDGEAEKQTFQSTTPTQPRRASAFRSLDWLDRYLAAWILLAMIVGVLLGNFVPETGEALKEGSFVDVSAPIGESPALIHWGPWRFR